MIRLLIVSHCLLNTAAKLKRFDVEKIAAEESLRRSVVENALAAGIQLLQLPCPEFMMYGAGRWGHTYEQFDNPFFRENCRELLLPILRQIQEYLQHGDDFEILGVLGIDGSPSCGVKYTCHGPWGGELAGRPLAKVLKGAALAEGNGVMIEELRRLLAEHNLEIKMEGLYAPEPERALSLLNSAAS